MADDGPDRELPKFRSDNATVALSDGTENIDLENPSMSVEETAENFSFQSGALNNDLTYSFTAKIEGEVVVCPACNTANSAPPSPLLSMLTDEPLPCVECGYPLL